MEVIPGLLMLISFAACSFLIGGLIWLLIGPLFTDVSALTGSFNTRWPPIDDDEFIRRCSPDVNRDIALRVRRIVSEQLGIPYDQIYPDQNFVKDLDCY